MVKLNHDFVHRQLATPDKTRLGVCDLFKLRTESEQNIIIIYNCCNQKYSRPIALLKLFVYSQLFFIFLLQCVT